MPTTAQVLFTNVAQPVTAATDWNNLDNIKADDTSYADTFPNSGESEIVECDTPIGIAIPAGNEITFIQVQIRAKMDVGFGELDTVNIAGQTPQTKTLTTTMTTHTFFGDLTFWGITQQQAQDFANGDPGTPDNLLRFRADGQSTPASIHVEWAKVQFTYERIANTARLPALF